MRARRRSVVAGVLAPLLLAGCASDPSIVDEDLHSGFVLYRSGRLAKEDLAALCARGLRELIVLDGSASERECRWRDQICPDLRIRYDHEQDARQAVEEEFLEAFDRWIGWAQQQGWPVAIRCTHGWHRTGRLAAWYRIRFLGWSLEDAGDEMMRRGQFMSRFPELVPQVAAMSELAAGEECTGDPGCPESSTALPPGLVEGPAGPEFPVDACRAEPLRGGSS